MPEIEEFLQRILDGTTAHLDILIVAAIGFFAGVFGWCLVHLVLLPARELLRVRRSVQEALYHEANAGDPVTRMGVVPTINEDLKRYAASLLSLQHSLGSRPNFLARRVLKRYGLRQSDAIKALTSLANAYDPADRTLYRLSVEEALRFSTKPMGLRLRQLSSQVSENWKVAEQTEQQIRETIDRALKEGCDHQVVTARAIKTLREARPDLTEPDALKTVQLLRKRTG